MMRKEKNNHSRSFGRVLPGQWRSRKRHFWGGGIVLFAFMSRVLMPCLIEYQMLHDACTDFFERRRPCEMES
jgi:hypothetical protein